MESEQVSMAMDKAVMSLVPVVGEEAGCREEGRAREWVQLIGGIWGWGGGRWGEGNCIGVRGRSWDDVLRFDSCLFQPANVAFTC